MPSSCMIEGREIRACRLGADTIAVCMPTRLLEGRVLEQVQCGSTCQRSMILTTVFTSCYGVAVRDPYSRA